jgi:CRISPR-associated protein Cmr3
MCRAWPWEWYLADPENSQAKKGNLVSVATDKPIPISGRMREKDKDSKSIPAPQVFAAPPGSVYYLNQPQGLFEESKKVKTFLQLGYSQLLWIQYKS